MTLTEFLLARIAEDEEAARHSLAGDLDHLPSVTTRSGDVIHLGITNPARVLAECEAKRRIVEDEHGDGRDGDYIEPFCRTCSDDESLTYLPCPTLRILAVVYADHPDYREEWKP